MEKIRSTKGALLFLAGSLVGVGLALLFAPQSGKRTRRDVADFGKMAQKKSKAVQLELRRAIDGLTEDVSEKIQDGVDRGRQWTDTTTQGILEALNSGKDYIRNEIDKVIQGRA
jgi:gas vesicle protein